MTSSLPQLMRSQQDLMDMIKENIEQQQHNQNVQTTISAELNDLKKLVQRFENHLLSLESNIIGSNSDPRNMPLGGSQSKVNFQSITRKCFTSEKLESYFGDITTKICKLIR